MNFTGSSSTINQDLEYLYALDGRGIKLGLKRIEKILEKLGNPQEGFRSVHVAGTNGKGSTCALVASILKTAGYKVGLYTSPHLVSFNERIRVNDKKITDSEISDFIKDVRPLIDEIDTTFFETTTAMAFNYFREKNVDFAVLETGMGGRYDATNVVYPEVSIITPIGKDHEEHLGRTIYDIAKEKAGIGKKDIPCIISRQQPKVKKVLVEELGKRESPYYYVPDECKVKLEEVLLDRQYVTVKFGSEIISNIMFPLIGKYQLINLQTAIYSISFLNDVSISRGDIVEGIEKTVWPGRLQVLQREPLVFYDVGHNVHGIRNVVKTIADLFPDRAIDTIIVLGSKKKYNSLGRTLGKLGGRIYISEIPDHKSAQAEEIADAISKEIPENRLVIENDLKSLLSDVLRKLNKYDILLIMGSHYIAPIIYPFFKIFV